MRQSRSVTPLFLQRFAWLVLAWICLLMPLPNWLNVIKPMVLLCLLVRWRSDQQHPISHWGVVLTGLVTDLLQGSVLGTHAVIFLVSMVLTDVFVMTWHARMLWRSFVSFGFIVMSAVVCHSLLIVWMSPGDVTGLLWCAIPSTLALWLLMQRWVPHNTL